MSGRPAASEQVSTHQEETGMTKRLVTSIVGLGLVALTATACSTLAGAAVGAGAGAAIGAGTGKGAGKGALVGTGVGAAAGTIYDWVKK